MPALDGPSRVTPVKQSGVKWKADVFLCSHAALTQTLSAIKRAFQSEQFPASCTSAWMFHRRLAPGYANENKRQTLNLRGACF